MRGDIVCITENMRRLGYDLVDLANVPEDAFPVYGVMQTDRVNGGIVAICHPVNRHLFEWALPPNADEYIETVEKF